MPNHLEKLTKVFDKLPVNEQIQLFEQLKSHVTNNIYKAQEAKQDEVSALGSFLEKIKGSSNVSVSASSDSGNS